MPVETSGHMQLLDTQFNDAIQALNGLDGISKTKKTQARRSRVPADY